MDEIFLAYGVRGIAQKNINEELVKKIAWAFGRFIKNQTYKSNPAIVLMRDARVYSPDFYEAAYLGLSHSGAKVIALGPANTPMCIFAINHLSADGGLVITASHNPPEYNGIKFFNNHTFQIGHNDGLGVIKELTKSAPDIPNIQIKDAINIIDDYISFLYAKFYHIEKFSRPINIAIDNGNGVVSLILDKLLARFPWIKFEKLFWEPDGNFPGRGPNPLIENALTPLQQLMRTRKYDLGVAFDADGDRAFFVDEKGEIITGDFIMALFAEEFLVNNPHSKIVVPVGSPRIVEDVVSKIGGKIVFSKVGSVFIRPIMQTENAIFGAERSCHFYFRDFFNADCGIWAFFMLLKIYLEKHAPISEIVKQYKKYYSTGEINIKVKDRALAIENIRKIYMPIAKNTNDLDGFFADFGDWWMIVRPSNTEPLLRIVIESADSNITEKARREVLNLLMQR